ncbi:methanogenesis marker protein 11 [Methanobacterium lacus]|uniref:Methanogenesis marker protein 11 n=1 Tax=Methanobacterium lacus (strain AL-21) TaxID=877455 RepID=F0T7U0_METLA|nr:methanogenesis marker protein 11 [Methanobacterium lacus]ADZ08427.1 methanogenesis marker protein 11 [Methanobacterium lacus]
MEILTPENLKDKFKDPWIAPYKKVITMVDKDRVELVEYHPCVAGSEWMVYQYKRTSDLVTESKRDGDKHIFQLKVGKADMELKPSYSAAGIEEVVVDDDEVKVVHAGLAGAGVGAAMCRGMAKGVKRVELYDIGGGSKVGRAAVVTPKLQKVIVGIDDTDTKEEGATWTLANNIGIELSKRGFEYLDHVTCQLYPHNPNKTQNCVAIALVFAVKPEMKEEMINKICEILKRDTLSDKTAIAVMDGFDVPDVLREYGEATKKSMMTVEDAENVAKKAGVKLIQVTGAPGEIGALAALGLYNDLEEAVKVYY